MLRTLTSLLSQRERKLARGANDDVGTIARELTFIYCLSGSSMKISLLIGMRAEKAVKLLSLSASENDYEN